MVCVAISPSCDSFFFIFIIFIIIFILTIVRVIVKDNVQNGPGQAINDDTAQPCWSWLWLRL